ncbi:MAG: excinuclease ABC subunit C [Bacteroidales bacterium]|nr:excinuclease ABC subunit C [Bacteroidales bacterium]
MKSSEISIVVSNLPHKPGVYKFYNKEDKIIYIGKAKDLKKRVSSYFIKNAQSYKLKLLVNKIASIQYIVVGFESEALLLENSLIKEYQPYYNVQLKDDKSYPYIVLRNEPFPRVYPTRNKIMDGSYYYGPFTSARMVRSLTNLLRQMYKLRNCKLNLTENNIQAKKFKVCLEYHIGNCLGPCVGHESRESYEMFIGEINDILKGDVQKLLHELESRMKDFSSRLMFESAQEIKERIDLIKGYYNKSVVVNPKIKNIDVFTIAEFDNKLYCNYLKIIDGAILNSHNIEVVSKADETKEEILSALIFEIRVSFNSKTKDILVNTMPEIVEDGLNYTVPKAGDKLKLIDLSLQNARFYQLERRKLATDYKQSNKVTAVEKLKQDLNLSELPVHIECFDNSNMQGSNPVAACVVFKDGKPAKKDYRHFHVKTVEGPNDFASMEEIVYRRYKRMLEEEVPLPQLIIIDGGKGQLSSAYKSLEKLQISNKVKIIGIAKKLEEIFRPGDPVPLYIDKNSHSLKLIQNLRNEAHRFGITFHRQVRSKKMTVSYLEGITGIGQKTAETLLTRFKSVKQLKLASMSEVENLVGKQKAAILFEHLNNI